MLLVEMAGIFVSFRFVSCRVVVRGYSIPVESRVIGIRGARVHENWGRVQRATRERHQGWRLPPSLSLSTYLL